MHYCFCLVKFIYSEKATKFCEIFTLVLSYVVVKILSILVVFLENMNFIHCTSLNAARSLAMPQSVSARMLLHASEAFCSSFSMPLLHSLYPRPSIHNTHISCLHISIAIKKMLVWWFAEEPVVQPGCLACQCLLKLLAFRLHRIFACFCFAYTSILHTIAVRY